MSDNAKISIRFFDDREVRAIWDEENNKWWFSVLDIVAVLTSQDDYTKTRNYWKYLKAKLKKETNELVSATNQLKLMAADGKRYLTDTLDYDGVISLANLFVFLLHQEIRDVKMPYSFDRIFPEFIHAYHVFRVLVING